MATEWNDIEANQMLTLGEVKLAVDRGILTGDNRLAPDIPENELISAAAFQSFVTNRLNQTLDNNQIVWKDVVDV